VEKRCLLQETEARLSTVGQDVEQVELKMVKLVQNEMKRLSLDDFHNN